MEWYQLEYFAMVARLQHVSRAADRLGISQPALSRSIHRLERDLGVELFERSGRAIRLTRAGEEFLPYAERALQELSQGRRVLNDLQGSTAQTIALGFLHTLGVEFVPKLVRAFKLQRPDVGFDFDQNASHVILRKLEEGDLDLCFASGPIDDARLTWERLVDEEVIVIVPKGHRLAARRSVQIRELADEQFISYKSGLTMRELGDDLCSSAGFGAKIAFEGDEPGTVGGFVAAGLGIAIVPADTSPVRHTVRLRISAPMVKRSLGIVWATNRYLSAAARAFRDHAIERYKAHCSPDPPAS